MGTGVEDVLPIGHKEGAGRPTLQGTNGLRFIGAISCRIFHLHGKNLIALESPLGIVALECKCFAVGAPVGLGIVAAKSQLTDVLEVCFRNLGWGSNRWWMVLCNDGRLQQQQQKKRKKNLAHNCFDFGARLGLLPLKSVRILSETTLNEK
jgi:hypothetical protein